MISLFIRNLLFTILQPGLVAGLIPFWITGIRLNNIFNEVWQMQTYFDALYCCDTELLNKVFHKDSSLFDVDEGKVFVEPIESFSRAVGSRVSPESKGQDPEAEILLIDWLSPSCATVKIRIRAHKNIFVDHLGFVNGEDGWQIVSKIWHLEKTID